MQEIANIFKKYNQVKLTERLSNKKGLAEFSVMFYQDIAEFYDAVTRIKNVERNPTGFNLNDAAILGLLVRIWKLLKEVVLYYKNNNGQIISHFDRQIVEAAITASYLLISEDDGLVEDYRKCSYKNRLKALEEESSREFYKSPAGVRLIKSIRAKMQAEGFNLDSFELQKRRRWKLGGKSFKEIFEQLEPEGFYKHLYGIPSESLHGSWNESLDFDLIKNNDGTYSTNPFYQPVDIRFVTPILRLTNDPYMLWLERIDCSNEYLDRIFKLIENMNKRLYIAFEETYNL